MTTTENTTERTVNSLRNRGRWIVVLVAMSAAVATWTVAVPLLGIQLLVNVTGSVRGVGQLDVALSSLAAGLLGWALLAILERTTRHAGAIWIAIATLVLLVSLLGALAATTVSGLLVLLVLHLVTGLILIAGLPTIRGGLRPRR